MRGTRIRGVALPAVGLLVLAAASGCRSYHYVVRTDGAPLYADEDGEDVIGRMDQFHHESLGVGDPTGDRVEVTYQGREGYADPADVRVFSYDSGTFARAQDRNDQVRHNLREVILETTPWPRRVEAAIRDDRLLKGMTREQVELAWGLPNTIVPDGRGGGGERWVFRITRYEEREAVHSGYTYAHFRSYGGCGSYGRSIHAPIYTTYVTRYTVPVSFRRDVYFDADGRLAGWTSDDL